MAVISLLGSVLLIGFAIWTMWATVAPSFSRVVAVLSNTPSVSTYVNVSGYQRRPVNVTTRARFSRVELRAAA